MNIYREKRISSGLKFSEAAKQLNISICYLSYIENNHRKPGRDLIVKMCRLYNCKLEELFHAI